MNNYLITKYDYLQIKLLHKQPKIKQPKIKKEKIEKRIINPLSNKILTNQFIKYSRYPFYTKIYDSPILEKLIKEPQYPNNINKYYSKPIINKISVSVIEPSKIKVINKTDDVSLIEPSQKFKVDIDIDSILTISLFTHKYYCIYKKYTRQK